MADGATPNYSFVLPEVGASTDTWGDKLNTNWGSVDTILAAKQDAPVGSTPETPIVEVGPYKLTLDGAPPAAGEDDERDLICIFTLAAVEYVVWRLSGISGVTSQFDTAASDDIQTPP